MGSLLRNARYRNLFIAQVVALLGTGVATVALGLLAYDLAGPRASAVLGAALAVKMAAYVLVAPLVGAVADRVPRRRLMAGADLVRAAVVLTLPWVTQVWQVFVLIAVLQAASATFTPVFQSVLPDLLPDEGDYARALSASQVAMSAEAVLSPLLAAAALLVLAPSALFGWTSAGFLASAALVAATAVPAVRRTAHGGFGARLAVGMRLFRATPQLRALLALNLVVATAGAISLVTTVNVVRDLLGGDDGDVGLLLAVTGAGAGAAALCAPRLARRAGDRVVMLAGAGIAVAGTLAALGVAAAPSWPAATVAWALIGFGPGWIGVTTGRVLRRCCAPAQRPALFAAQFSLSHACWLLTYPLTGWLAAGAGFGAAWTTLAVLAAAATLVAARAWPALGGDHVRHRHGPDTPDGHLSGPGLRPAARGWTHAHAVVVDREHPHGPVPV
ncbi:MFS transporter [Pseudonocardia nematodicida]|uniref:MFS transporter n=1 Tax=Pseudonocardia nematodicida TaxID=1206997 RepID=A0ABV1K4W6_9PSEU